MFCDNLTSVPANLHIVSRKNSRSSLLGNKIEQIIVRFTSVRTKLEKTRVHCVKPPANTSLSF